MSAGIFHMSTKRRLKWTILPLASTTRMPSAVASIVASSNATDRCSSARAFLRSVMSKATPTTPRMLPSASRRGSTWDWKARPFHSASYVTDSPRSARRCAAIGGKAGSVVLKYEKRLSPRTSSVSPIAARPAPVPSVKRRSRSVVQSTAGIWETRTRRRSSFPCRASAASRSDSFSGCGSGAVVLMRLGGASRIICPSGLPGRLPLQAFADRASQDSAASGEG